MKSLILSLVMLNSINCFAEEAKKEPTYKIRWVLAHEPIGLFKEAAEVFNKEVFEKTHGDMSVEVLTSKEYVDRYQPGKKLLFTAIGDLVANGKAEMSQTYTTDLGRKNNDLWVLDLPYLFKSHDHATKVLEGETGKKLLAGLRKSNLEGLAFTYSGGYRVIPGTKKLEKYEDFKGLKIRTSPSPVAHATWELLGAVPITAAHDYTAQGLKNGDFSISETTYPRYYAENQKGLAKIMNETNHSLFLTSIIVNEDFYKKLPDNYKQIVRDAAFKAARVERDKSIQSGVESKEQCIKDGVQVVNMSKDEQARFEKKLKPIYGKFEKTFSKGLITEIEKQN